MSNQVQIVGNPEFWQTAHDLNPKGYEAIQGLIPIYNELTSKRVTGPLLVTVRRTLGVVMNSMGAVVILALNGYGADAMRIVRGMFEAETTVAYLRLHPELIQDYVDYIHVAINAELAFLEGSDPDLLREKVPAELLSKAKASYARVEARFKATKGYDRSSWCKASLYEMAEETKRKDQYRTVWRWASGIHHGDVTGLVAQFDKDSLDVDIAPSKVWVKDALMIGHAAVLSVMKDFDAEAKFGFDANIEASEEAFREAWKAELQP